MDIVNNKELKLVFMIKTFLSNFKIRDYKLDITLQETHMSCSVSDRLQVNINVIKLRVQQRRKKMFYYVVILSLM